MKIRLNQITTTATTCLRGKIKIFQLIEKGVEEQRFIDWQKAGLYKIYIPDLEILLKTDRKDALRFFLSKIKTNFKL